jgi:hypothetical protein
MADGVWSLVDRPGGLSHLGWSVVHVEFIITLWEARLAGRR